MHSLLNMIAILQRPLNTQDSSAGVTKDFDPAIPGNYPAKCTVQPLRTWERQMFAQRQIFVSHRLLFECSLNPQKGDRLFIPKTQQIFVIVGFRNQAGRNRVWSIDANEQT
jgi:hypothetical protein